MLPLGPRLAVRRQSGEVVRPSGLVLPATDTGDSLIGEVTAAGRSKTPLAVGPGDRIIYSSRCDSFETDEGMVDIVDENSVIGLL